MHILLVEDSGPTRDLLQRSLGAAGHILVCAARKSKGLDIALEQPFDVIVIDVMLPDGSGLDLCRELRREAISTPILFLTARGEVGDRIVGLDAGGDDYLKKPFAIAELHARLRALGRRQAHVTPTRVERPGLVIDFSARRLERAGAEIPLTAREWSVLEALAARAGRVLRRDDLLEAAWGDTSRAASESLDVIISRLRRKLTREGEAQCIRTVRGQGYVFEDRR